MDDLASLLGISKKTIYTVFPDKNSLVLEMVDYCFSSIKESEQKVLQDLSLDTVGKIRAILGVLPEGYRELDLRQLYQLKERYPEVYEKVTENSPQLEAFLADAAYKTPHICKKVFDDGRVLSTAYKRPQTMKNGHEWWKYVYDEFYDCVICPEYQPLKYSTTNRDGYREYKSDPNICAACPTRERCTHSRDCIKTVQRHIWKDYEELADDARYTPAYAQLYKCRKETIERVFADAKEKHAMRYTQYRGLAQVTNWVKLKFAAMNLKKLATWKWRDLLSSFRFAVFSLIYVRDPVCS